MGFHYGQYSLPGLVAEIAAELAATPAFTMHDESVAGGYCLRNVANPNLYVMIEIVNNVKYGQYYTSGQDAYFSGIGMRFSTDWDIVNHVPAGTIRRYAFAPLFCSSGSTSGCTRLGVDSTYQVNYWLDQFGLVGVIQNPYSDYESSGAFFALEFVPDASKEFNDGFTNVMAFTKRNNAYYYSSNVYPPDGSVTVYYHALRPFNTETGLTLHKETELTPGYRSLGNSKVYFEFGTMFNERVNWRTPIFQTKRWFFVREDSGLSLNDVVSWLDPDNVTVHKFFITAATCPDTSNKVIVGIPYENAYEY